MAEPIYCLAETLFKGITRAPTQDSSHLVAIAYPCSAVPVAVGHGAPLWFVADFQYLFGQLHHLAQGSLQTGGDIVHGTRLLIGYGSRPYIGLADIVAIDEVSGDIRVDQRGEFAL